MDPENPVNAAQYGGVPSAQAQGAFPPGVGGTQPVAAWPQRQAQPPVQSGGSAQAAPQQHSGVQPTAASAHSGTHHAPATQAPGQPAAQTPAQTPAQTTGPAAGQPSTFQAPVTGAAPAATPASATSAQGPVRRASLRTGVQETTDAGDGKKRFALGRKPSGDADAKTSGGPRKVRVMLSSVDPWSITKMSFLLAIAGGIAFCVAVSIAWGILNGMGVQASLQEQITTLFGEAAELNILQYLEYSKVMSLAILLASVNVVIITALGAIGALLYNVVSTVVGGVFVTLADD